MWILKLLLELEEITQQVSSTFIHFQEHTSEHTQLSEKNILYNFKK